MIAAAALLGALIVLAALLIFSRLGDAGDGLETADPVPERSTTSVAPTEAESEPSSSTTSTPPPTTATPDPEPDVITVACPEGVIAEICDAAEFVQQVRGRPFKEFPEVELMDDAAFDAELTRDLEAYRGELEEDERLLKALGLLETDVELFATYQSFVEVGVAGFYRTDTGQLVVRGGEFNLYGQLVLVHELVHAFDDQWHELERDFADDDADFAFAALVEGNASRVENEWRSRLTGQEQSELSQQELSAIPVEDLTRLLAIPEIVLDLQLAAYSDGESFVAELFVSGGEEAVDDAYVDPPASSEQVLHPDLLDASAGLVIEVEPPPTDGAATSTGVLGELVLRSWLGGTAARGWGGDAYAIWETGAETCLTVDVAADGEADLDEIDTAARQWARSGSAIRSVERIDLVDRSMIRITGCY